MMDALESRTHFSVASPKIVNIGPSRAIKTLSAAPWPSKGQTVKFVLDYSSTPYVVKNRQVSGNLTITAADPGKKPVLKLGASYKQHGGKMVAGDGSLKVFGTLNISNVKTVGGDNTIFLGSVSGANIDCENIEMDGGAVWKGTGANNVVFKNNIIHGNPRGNVYANWNNRVKSCIIDHSGTSVPIPQGGRFVKGNPIGESPIRVMNVDSLTLKGIKTKPWFYKGGKIWKQDLQIRPSSGTIKVIDCNFYIADVGDMVWRKPALKIRSVEFINCTMKKMPHLTGGVLSCKMTNCLVGGARMTKTLQ